MSGEQTVGIDTSDAGDPGDAGGPAHPGRSPGRRRLVVGILGGLAVIAFVLWWFQPQALFIDDVVDEQLPLSADGDDAAAGPDPADGENTADGNDTHDTDATPNPDTDATPNPDTDATPNPDTDATPNPDESPATTGPVALRSGDFSSRNRYEVSGTATAFALDDTGRILRLEDFESTNGPDLFVYLTVADVAATDAELDADFIDLGRLTGNIGNQNYVIPPEVDLELHDTVVIWCKRFGTSFGAADLVVTTT